MLTDVDLRRCLFAVVELHERQRRKDAPVRASWTPEMIEKLCRAIAEVSRPRQPEAGGKPHSNHELLSARQVSTRLGWCVRRVQRRAPELGGELIGGRWMFNAESIDEHLGGRQ